MPSFDIVSEVDLQEIDNAINISKKELANRFDFKGSKSSLEWDKKGEIILIADDEFKLSQLRDILETKLARRHVSILSLDYQKIDDANLGCIRQKVCIKKGVNKEDGKKLIVLIKETKLKVQAQLMDDQIRVTGKKIDDLQTVIGILKQQSDVSLPLQFVNIRS